LVRVSSTIVVAGPSCAGKSTIVATLSALPKAITWQARSVDLVGFSSVVQPVKPLILAFAKFFSRRRSMNSSLTLETLLEDRPSLFCLLFKLWLVLDTFTVYARFLLEVYLPSKLGYSVIVEFGWADWLAIYLYLCRLLGLPYNATLPWTDLVRRLLRLVHPARALFVDAEASALEARWRQRGAVQTWTTIAEMRELQRSVSLSLVRNLCDDVVRLDSTSKATLTSKQVREAVSDLLSKS
jgi:hypothetical protein